MNNHIEAALRVARRNRRLTELKRQRVNALKQLEAIDSEIYSLEQEALRER